MPCSLPNACLRSCQSASQSANVRSILNKAWHNAATSRLASTEMRGCYRRSLHIQTRQSNESNSSRLALTFTPYARVVARSKLHGRSGQNGCQALLHTQTRLHNYNNGGNQWQNGSQSGNYQSSSRLSSIRTIKWIIIGINTVIFGAWSYANQQRDRKVLRWLHDNTLCSWYNVNEGRWWTMITSAFSHQGLAHFLFNMFAIDAFTDIIAVSGLVSAPGLICLVVGGAFISSYAQLYNIRSQRSQIGSYAVEHSSALGASGIAMSLAALSTCIMPRAPMMLFIIPMPLWALSAGYVAFDLYYRDSGSRIGHYAHLGGFGFGLAYFLLLTRKTPSSILGMLRRR
ncbi:hypothetical protein MRB53_037252 [Persea americana]|nr:hypothetical protein MRB53_037252 [Persea americana]